MTRRFEALIKSIIAGSVDNSQLDVLAAIEVPALGQQLKAYGNLERLVFISKLYVSSGKVYTYQAVFSNRKALLQVLMDRNGKVGNIQLFAA